MKMAIQLMTDFHYTKSDFALPSARELWLFPEKVLLKASVEQFSY